MKAVHSDAESVGSGPIPQDEPQFSRPPAGIAAYGVAILFVVIALFVRMFLNAVLGDEAPYLPFVLAVIGAAWYGGGWPGLLATLLSGIIASTFFIEPAVTIPFTNLRATLWLFTFLGIGGLVSWLNESLHRGLRHVKDALSKQQEAEAKAMESEARFRQAIEEAPFPTILHAEDDSILTVNRVWVETTGYTLEQLPKVSDWLEKACKNKEEARMAGIRTFTANQGRLDHGEFIVVTAHGEERVWEFSSSVLGKLPNSRVVAISMANDITKRKRTEEALIRLNTAVEAAANGIVIVDRDGVILWVNPAFTRITGYSKDEAVGQHTRILKSGIHDRRFYHDLWSTVIAGRVWRGVIALFRAFHEENACFPLDGVSTLQPSLPFFLETRCFPGKSEVC